MYSLKQTLVASLYLASSALATPCPYGQLAERGQLNEEDSAKFFAARAEGPVVVEEMMHEKVKREHAEQEVFYKRQLDLGELLFGGGLLGGLLQPFTGVLAALDGMTLSTSKCVLTNMPQFLHHKNSA